MKKLFLTVMSVILPALLFVQVSAQVGFTNYTQTEGLTDNYVCGGIAIDANNVKWFGTQSGLSRFDGTTWQTFNTDDGLISNYIQCVAVDNNSNIWIGTDNGVSKFDGTNFTNYTTTDGLADNSILYIACDPSGYLWFASFSGLSRYNGVTFSYYTTTEGMSSNMISYIYPIGSDLYIGTFDAGMMVFDGATFESITETDGLLSSAVTAIASDNNGKIWVGSYSGITVLNTDYSVSTTYTMTGALLNNYVQDIAIDDYNNVVVTEYADYLSDGGISMFSNSIWTNYVLTDGLVDVMTKRVEFDENSFAWITTGGGVSKMDTDASIGLSFSSEVFVYPNPSTDKVFIDNSSGSFSYKIIDVDGRIVAAANDVDGNSINLNNIATGVYILNYNTNGKTFSSKIIKE